MEEGGEEWGGVIFETRGSLKAIETSKGELRGWCSWQLGGVPVESPHFTWEIVVPSWGLRLVCRSIEEQTQKETLGQFY